HEFTRHGMRSPAYTCIVAGGNNACTLHSTANDAVLRDGDLLLIDAGAEHDQYAADITRTFPVNGHFSEAQRALYHLVLEAQQA
ncbi:M24 family metallopeptidase, partial [Methylococcus sp. S2T]|uniref:M24 family metallopeptidase n=1 Tax=Methylococcus sp. S2T TaxID=3438967 RepID=UPI003ED85BE0